MNDFFGFYQDGGVFMHFISAAGVFGAVALRKALRRQDLAGQLQIMSTMAKVCILLGVLGTAMGAIEMFHVLGNLKPNITVHRWLVSMARGGRVALHTLVWGLMLGTPLALAEGLLQRHFRREAEPTA